MFKGLIAGDSNATINLFVKYLTQASRDSGVTADEILYTASVLAHFAMTSCSSDTGMPTPATLMDIFDKFLLDTLASHDPELMEFAGSGSLLLVGFFRDQMRRRYNLHWYDAMGGTFYSRASQLAKNSDRKKIMRQMARNFPIWAHACCLVSQILRREQYLFP